MENQTEKRMYNEMGTGGTWGIHSFIAYPKPEQKMEANWWGLGLRT